MHTWSGLFSGPKLLFALRNTLSIFLTFVLGYYCDNALFTPYSATMSGTLSLLVSHFPGSALAKNLKRLLGVTLGKVLPIIIMGLCSFSPCGSYMRYFSKIISLFFFTWL